MIEDIYKIQFKGAAFTQETILPFLIKKMNGLVLFMEEMALVKVRSLKQL